MMLHSWHTRLAAWFTVASAPSANMNGIHRLWGILGLLVGSIAAIKDIAELIAEPTASWRVASAVFALRGLLVALVGLWIAVRPPGVRPTKWRKASVSP